MITCPHTRVFLHNVCQLQLYYIVCGAFTSIHLTKSFLPWTVSMGTIFQPHVLRQSVASLTTSELLPHIAMGEHQRMKNVLPQLLCHYLSRDDKKRRNFNHRPAYHPQQQHIYTVIESVRLAWDAMKCNWAELGTDQPRMRQGQQQKKCLEERLNSMPVRIQSETKAAAGGKNVLAKWDTAALVLVVASVYHNWRWLSRKRSTLRVGPNR